MRRLLIIGASELGSLGSWCKTEAMTERSVWEDEIVTAGISGNEDLRLNVTSEWQVERLFETEEPFTDIICTAGINVDSPLDSLDFGETINLSFEVNAYGPILAFDMWLRNWKRTWEAMDEAEMFDWLAEHDRLNFVAVSSNSAHIARSGSTGYCMSKAALSMGIRCVARACAEEPVNVWGYEPGFISGTPMSKATVERFGEAPHRIPGNRVASPERVAHTIIKQIIKDGGWLNGSMIRMDGGEQ